MAVRRTVVGGTPSLPVYAGWCQARTLGMKVQVYSDAGEPIEATGEPGELVCTAPFPSQPVFFWGDKDGKRYQSAYFERFPGPPGVRFGSAEIYNALNIFTEIEDSLCVGQRRPSDRDEQVLLIVKMKEGHAFDHKLKKAIEARIRQDLSPRHVPKFIYETQDIPMTVNGKKTELPVRKIVSGQKITPSSTIVNPGCLKWYEQFARVDGGPSPKAASKL
ncbi:hypothetical protein H2202_003284 [Exophiala xenobiotica]|nr:hypothetical protein H2202_003284 [Exophiala xenobiotica]